MSAPPRATNEYSRGSGASGGVPGDSERQISRGSGGVRAAPFGRIGAGIFAGTLVGAILLVVAEFTTLYTVHGTNSRAPAVAVRTGSNDSYAFIPIAILVLILAFAVLRAGSRPALLAIGIAGVVAILIALVGDLPDTQRSLLTGCNTGQCVTEAAHASTGMYLETAGAVLLLAVSGLGFLLLGRPLPPPRRAAEAPPAPAEAPPAPPDAPPAPADAPGRTESGS